MARTPSTMLPLGTRAPDFDLLDYDGRRHRLSDFDQAPGLLVMFLCNHCPFVIHVREELARLTGEYAERGVAVVGVMSNDYVSYPDDAPALMKLEAQRQGYRFPYLVDEDQAVAKAYRAACTPDFFLFDGERRLVYRGQLDGSRPGNGVSVTGSDLRRALDALLEGAPQADTQLPSIGCNIKWKPGGEPPYFG
jgi:peroxiredoxin